jgi:hypothetical protein
VLAERGVCGGKPDGVCARVEITSVALLLNGLAVFYRRHRMDFFVLSLSFFRASLS